MTNFKRLGYTILLIFIWICIPLATHAQHISNGLLDARYLDLSSRIQLSGHWKFCPDQFVEPGAFAWSSCSELLVPSLWSDQNKATITATHGSYHLEILLPANDTSQLALEIPQLYNSYNVFIDDHLVASNGTPGPTRETTKPEWRPQYITFPRTADTLRITLQLSGFHHNNAGIREPILFGHDDAIHSHFQINFVSTIVEVVVLIILSIFFWGIWFFRNRARISLYFSFFCVSWAIRELFSDIYPITALFPEINWFLLVKVEYISLYLIVIFAISFMNRLFPDLTNVLLKYMIVIINLIFVIYTVFAPVESFTKWLPLYIIVAGITMAYACIITIRALILDKTGAWPLVIGLLLMIVTSGYDVIAYKAAIVNNIFIGNIAYCLILISCGVGLLQHLDIIGSGPSDNRLRYQDLYK